MNVKAEILPEVDPVTELRAVLTEIGDHQAALKQLKARRKALLALMKRMPRMRAYALAMLKMDAQELIRAL